MPCAVPLHRYELRQLIRGLKKTHPGKISLEQIQVPISQLAAQHRKTLPIFMFLHLQI